MASRSTVRMQRWRARRRKGERVAHPRVTAAQIWALARTGYFGTGSVVNGEVDPRADVTAAVEAYLEDALYRLARYAPV
jgi:hypothetical protein